MRNPNAGSRLHDQLLAKFGRKVLTVRTEEEGNPLSVTIVWTPDATEAEKVAGQDLIVATWRSVGEDRVALANLRTALDLNSSAVILDCLVNNKPVPDWAKIAISDVAVQINSLYSADAPKITAPANLNTNGASPLSLGQISVVTGAVNLCVEFRVTDGTIEMNGVAPNIEYMVGDGTATNRLMFKGEKQKVNNVLNQLRFRATPAFKGTAKVSMAANDLATATYPQPQYDFVIIPITVN